MPAAGALAVNDDRRGIGLNNDAKAADAMNYVIKIEVWSLLVGLRDD